MEESIKTNDKTREMVLYFGFAILMIILASIIKEVNLIYVYPYVSANAQLSSIGLIQTFYLTREPLDWTILVGEFAAVLITFVIKFILDKFIVFRKTDVNLKDTTIEITKYFGNAIITTIENISVSYFILVYIVENPFISTSIALSIGYILKYYLDKRFVFN